MSSPPLPETLTLTVIESMLRDHRCTCGGTVEISRTDEAPPGYIPIAITHTLPACAEFHRLDAAAFVSHLVQHLPAAVAP